MQSKRLYADQSSSHQMLLRGPGFYNGKAGCLKSCGTEVNNFLFRYGLPNRALTALNTT